jgi:hypothetical protein
MLFLENGFPLLVITNNVPKFFFPVTKLSKELKSIYENRQLRRIAQLPIKICQIRCREPRINRIKQILPIYVLTNYKSTHKLVKFV